MICTSCALPMTPYITSDGMKGVMACYSFICTARTLFPDKIFYVSNAADENAELTSYRLPLEIGGRWYLAAGPVHKKVDDLIVRLTTLSVLSNIVGTSFSEKRVLCEFPYRPLTSVRDQFWYEWLKLKSVFEKVILLQ